MRLKRPFFLRPPEVVAQDLLGKSLYFKGNRVIIVETESYGVNDPACHSFKGKTLRNEPMFKEGGRSYVYFIYGMHFCFNVVTEKMEIPSAVLIRGGIPLTLLKEIQDRRGKKESAEKILIGPGNFCRGLGIGREQNDIDLCHTPDFYFYKGDLEKVHLDIGISPRIGITEGKEKLWRFFLKNYGIN
ncbi:MAG: DNA-3-methyladenine glycosylase [Nitrospirae bacterium]|nr:DNA-3-methyladenine glycosylase [Nitrospirota bacterium]MBI3594784.1 DNA-3-methyladenine glycosylase [Nitrospirota bacterium]